MLKKVLSILLVALLGLSLLAGCGAKEEEEPATTETSTESTSESSTSEMTTDELKDIVIGVSVGTTKQERWQREIEMFKAYGQEYGFEVIVQSAEDEAQKQMQQCENLITQEVDVLILQALDSEAAGSIITSAHEAGIPVIAYDRLAMNGDLDYYVTFDSFKVGQVEAQFVVDNAPTGNYIWLKGGPEDFNAHEVARGQRSILQPYIDSGDINIVLEQWCDGWDPNKALEHTENGLTLANNDIQAVIASNDGTAGGAIAALDAQGLAGKVPIAGQDADIAACQRIVEGIQTGTVYKPTAMLNKAAMDLAVAVATGKDPMTSMDASLGVWAKIDNDYKEVDSFSVDVVAVDKDNIMDTVIADGYQSYEEVYKNVPEDQRPPKN